MLYMSNIFLFIIGLSISINNGEECLLPIRVENRKSVKELKLTSIGEFGIRRKERPKVPSHYHVGIDLKRPTNNYQDEPIYAISEGVVISKRDDGPYAQLIIEHYEPQKYWTVYEHIAGITVSLYDEVNTKEPIARFMNKEELNRYGWQFDHLHLEVLKKEPIRLKRDYKNPERYFSTYSLICFTKDELHRYYYNPLDFLSKQFKQ